MEVHIKRLGSHFSQPTAVERLQALHGFYRHGEEAEFRFDLKENRKLGHSFKDYICPDSMEFESDHFKVGERYGQAMFLKDYATFISDD